jgi:flagellar hook-length control protein FliK
MRLNAGAQYSSARMWLEPPELGRMQVDVRVHGRQVRIGVRTETAAARRIVAERAAELTDALRRHGITIEELEVTTVPDDESLTDVANPAQATPRGRLAAVDRSSRWPETNHGAATPDQPKTGKDNQGLVVAAESRLDVRA